MDAERVLAAAPEIAQDRPHYAREQIATAPPTDRPIEGLRGGGSPERKIEAPSWSEALGPFIGGA